MESGMRNRITNITVSLFLLASAFLLSADAGAQERDERAALLKQQRTLSRKVAGLKQEQNFLLFQKEMDSSDSKYLVLSSAKQNGQLKYKNRVLKDFPFTPAKNYRKGLVRQGAITLRKKTDDNSGHYVLQFDRSLILSAESTTIPKRQTGVPAFFLDEKDLLSIYSAIEPGARAYLLR